MGWTNQLLCHSQLGFIAIAIEDKVQSMGDKVVGVDEEAFPLLPGSPVHLDYLLGQTFFGNMWMKLKNQLSVLILTRICFTNQIVWEV